MAEDQPNGRPTTALVYRAVGEVKDLFLARLEGLHDLMTLQAQHMNARLETLEKNDAVQDRDEEEDHRRDREWRRTVLPSLIIACASLLVAFGSAAVALIAILTR